ncbi:probable Lactoylglutathione lyase [Zygosaccharomyces bailii ISA1307]|nr:probable Lactoylglutathione lyase [Zygosaccharomyces bailii ISA1307]
MLSTPLRRLGLIRQISRTMATATSEATYYTKKIYSAVGDPTLMLNHTCLRVKDPIKSVDFYKKYFGMISLGKKDFEDMKFSLYFLAFPWQNLVKNEKGEVEIFANRGVLELTHNWGTEKDPEFKINNGNEEPHRGFGHICFSVANIEETCKRLESEGVKFRKRMQDGRQKDIAFALDADGYWIELIQYVKEEGAGPKEDVGDRFNHTMIRVKDATKSLEFYRNVLGMTLHRTSEHPNAKFTLYFLGYDIPHEDNTASTQFLLELTHNWGTEKDPNFHYHNGNEDPQGYGHICISCKDPGVLCEEIEQKYNEQITWSPRWNHGKMKNLAFIKDPDGYSIEIVPSNLIL